MVRVSRSCAFTCLLEVVTMRMLLLLLKQCRRQSCPASPLAACPSLGAVYNVSQYTPSCLSVREIIVAGWGVAVQAGCTCLCCLPPLHQLALSSVTAAPVGAMLPQSSSTLMCQVGFTLYSRCGMYCNACVSLVAELMLALPGQCFVAAGLQMCTAGCTMLLQHTLRVDAGLWGMCAPAGVYPVAKPTIGAIRKLKLQPDVAATTKANSIFEWAW